GVGGAVAIDNVRPLSMLFFEHEINPRFKPLLLMRPRLCLLVALWISLAVASGVFGAVAVVENGAARADGILAAGATDEEKAAAFELINYVRRCTGAELPLRTRRAPGRAAVLLGASAAPEATQARVRQLRGDGFLLEVDGDTIVLAGNG